MGSSLQLMKPCKGGKIARGEKYPKGALVFWRKFMIRSFYVEAFIHSLTISITSVLPFSTSVKFLNVATALSFSFQVKRVEFT